MTLGTKMARIGFGDRDKLTEDELDCSKNANSYLTAERLTEKFSRKGMGSKV